MQKRCCAEVGFVVPRCAARSTRRQDEEVIFVVRAGPQDASKQVTASRLAVRTGPTLSLARSADAFRGSLP